MPADRRFPAENTPKPNRITLFTLSPSFVFWIGFIPPLAGAITAISSALILHQQKVTNYNWICGRAFLPSLSRIINLDFEGVFWQLFTYLHVPLRLIELRVGFTRYRRLRDVNCEIPITYEAARWAYAILGSFELFFLAGLSAIGEKEHGVVHIMFFYTFGVFALGFFIANAICHSQSLYYLNPYGRISYKLKLMFMGLYILSVPLIATFYAMYWKGCLTFAYELFALTEYIDVFVSMAYHGCALLDIRHKVVFRISYVPRSKRNRPFVANDIELRTRG